MYDEIVKYPDVFLRHKSKEVEFPLDDKTERLIKWMQKMMYKNHGIGFGICLPKKIITRFFCA